MPGLEFYLAVGFVFVMIGALIALILFGRKYLITKNMEILEAKERRMLNLENTLEETLEAFELFVMDAQTQIKSDYEKARELFRQMEGKIPESFNAVTKEDIESKVKELLNEERTRLKIMEQEAISKVIQEKQQLEQKRKQIAEQMEELNKRKNEFDVKKTSAKNLTNDAFESDKTKISGGSFAASSKNKRRAEPAYSQNTKEEKRMRVIELAEKGLNIDKIAKELDLTKGETKFILQLNNINKQ